MKRAIEDSFPIVEINRLAVPERNAFKPIYQMHKWFARRASCVFRAILLGALKPLPVDEKGNPTKSGAEVIMEEFYKDHTHDPDTNDKVILDPFMGGGTTIVEALRLGCRTIGIDLNPVAWFIVKTETEPVDLDELEAAFDRLAERRVEWSGKPLRETLRDLYKTTCPSCGRDADIIYNFWVKSAPCTAHNCNRQTPLFSNYILSKKTPSIRYIEDCDCPECGRVFDWEIEPACMIGDPKLLVNTGKYSAGHGRTSARWAYGPAEKLKGGGFKGTAPCPWCGKEVLPAKVKVKAKRKRIELTILLCPKCEEVWQFRGPLPDDVQCPTCRHEYAPGEGNIPSKGKYLCRCGNEARTIDAIRTLPEEQLMPMHAYGMECYCASCARRPGQKEGDDHPDLFVEGSPGSETPASLLWKNSGKFFKRVESADLARYQEACDLWEKQKKDLPYPKSKIPVGYNTNQMLKHKYSYWRQMFNPRQLLALSTLLKAVSEEQEERYELALLCTFSNTLEANNVFTRQIASRKTPGGTPPAGVFDRKVFQPKSTLCEQNVWGTKSGRGTFINNAAKVLKGKMYNDHPFDREIVEGKQKEVPSRERVSGVMNSDLLCKDSREIPNDTQPALIATDPPFGGNVNYSELADFFYVWLRLPLREKYPWFAPDESPKATEIIANPTRGMTISDFQDGLSQVFARSRMAGVDEAPLIFTFHHRDGEIWVALLKALFDAGYNLEAVYPIHGDAENTTQLISTSSVSYDLVHVCKSRRGSSGERRSWAGVRQEIRRRAREEIKAIESGRYGNEPLLPQDKNIVLIGKCLELYSKHYGNIVDHEGKPIPLKDALEEIRMMVDQMTSEGSALPSELEDIDAPSYVYLSCLCDRKEIKVDEVSKATRGICEPSTLMKWGLMTKGRAKRGRTYEVKSPLERIDLLKRKLGVDSREVQAELFGDDLSEDYIPGTIFVDYVHLLIGLVQTGESVLEWLDKFRGRRPEIRAALEFLEKKNRAFTDPVRKILGLIDEKTLFTPKDKENA